MPAYFFWGTDDFAIAQAVAALCKSAIDPTWESFNYDKIAPDHPNAVIHGLNQAMTPPFGAGQRFVWLVETALGQKISEATLAELDRTLSALPETSILLLTSQTKPDSRLKSTKLLQKYAEIREFSPIPTWKTDLIVKQVQRVAQELQLKLTPAATEFLAEAVGSNTRQLYTELEKLRLYHGDSKHPIDEPAIAALVITSTQTVYKLAEAIRNGQTAIALELVVELLRQNEPATRISNTLIGQFRTWLWVKLMIDAGERDETAIAKAAELRNPKQLYFLKKDLQPLSLNALLQTLPLLLQLDSQLKRSADDLPTLQTKVIELCELCQRR
jgi:DNA polymerase III subunit delta